MHVSEIPIPYFDLRIDHANYQPGFLGILKVVRSGWKTEEVKFKPLQQGYSNHMIICFTDEANTSDWIVARIFGIVDYAQRRDVEIKVAKTFSDTEIGPRVYATFQNGYFSGYIEGKTYSWNDLSAFRDPRLAQAVAREIAKVHSKKTLQIAKEKYKVEDEKDMEDWMKEMLGKWPETIIDEETNQWYMSQVPSHEDRQNEAAMLLKIWKNWNAPRAICHMDVNPTNIIYDEKNEKATLVDYEGGGITSIMFDLSVFLMTSSIGFAPEPTDELSHSSDFERAFFEAYDQQKNKIDKGIDSVDQKAVEKYLAMHNVMKIMFNYIWHILVVPLASTSQTRPGFDPKMFLALGLSRLNYYKKHKAHMLDLADKVPE